MSTQWQNLSVVLNNNTVVTTTYTGGNNDFQSITNYVQNQVTQRGLWIGNQFFPGTSISSITIS
jgi:hypothetical protein